MPRFPCPAFPLGTVASCDLGQATAPSRPQGPSIAAHVHHLAFSLAVTRARMAGDVAAADWDASWHVEPLDVEAWDALRARLAAEYRQTLDVIGTRTALYRGAGPGSAAVRVAASDVVPVLRTVTWALAHAAYHLSAIRTTAKRSHP